MYKFISQIIVEILKYLIERVKYEVIKEKAPLSEDFDKSNVDDLINEYDRVFNKIPFN